MENKFGDIRQTWRDRFGDSRQWMEEVFSRIYSDGEALAIESDGKAVSSLLLRDFAMTFHGERLAAGYICGAATARHEQGRGLMSQLMAEALREARRRGESVVILHPSRRRLYGFFAKFNFTTAILIDEMRYTSAHEFGHDNERYILEDAIYDYQELADAYERLAADRQSCVLHSADDFRTIMIDNEIERGLVSVARDAENGRIVAMALARINQYSGTLCVKELVGENEDAENAVLAQLSSSRPGLSTVVESYPIRKGVKYSARGMARITDAESILRLCAKIKPDMEMTLRLNDPIISENNGCFVVANGEVKRAEAREIKHPDLDVTIEVFTAIIFSGAEIGDIFNLPTARPFASMMLN